MTVFISCSQECYYKDVWVYVKNKSLRETIKNKIRLVVH